MCVALVGGLDRLHRRYIDLAQGFGVKLKVFSGKEPKISPGLGKVDMCLVFTNMVSHRAKQETVAFARRNNVPIKLSHSCGLSALARLLGERP
jgi:hypothetical protein